MLEVKKCSRHGLAAPAVVLSACTDRETRIAYDIEARVGAFRRSGAASYSIKHVSEAEPDGCAGPYSVQLSAASILVSEKGCLIVLSDGLRVCDASIFPNLPCANTNPPTMMTGECVAARILEESP
ncbi:MAG: GMC oxidoreductase [Burkholderiales bacterium]